MLDLRRFAGPNAAHVLDLYERYCRDPAAVDPATRAAFERWGPPAEAARPAAPGLDPARVAAAAALAAAIRSAGHLAARLDPLGRPRLPEPSQGPALEPASYGLTDAGLAALPAAVVGGPAVAGAGSALEALGRLRGIYCGTLGYELAHLGDAELRGWLRDAVEAGRYARSPGPEAERSLLRRLTQVEALERHLQRAYPARTRFSVEGADVLVPLLDEAIALAAAAGVCEVVLGMPHRGRLNVLAHVLGRPYAEVLAEFAGRIWQQAKGPPPADADQSGWSGDVTYHLGGSRAVANGQSVRILVKLAPNPSHLEWVDPVVEGMARALQDDRRRAGAPRQAADAALPILVHGEAAFTGQGVVAETLNLARLPGYTTGGTLHLLVDNELGFTAEPAETRSTRYPSDPARGYEVPIVHANADDPEACLTAVRLALACRQRFHRDFLIHLVGYRRRGHNESDEPAFTQPLLYDQIARHPTVREQYGRSLVARGVVGPDEPARLLQAALDDLREAAERGAAPSAAEGESPDATASAIPAAAAPSRPPAAEPETAVAAERLRQLNAALASPPAGFAPEPKLERLLRRRAAALGPAEAGPAAAGAEPAPGGEGLIDWGHAEALALATILADGVPVRLTGQDTERGTFSQRHAVLHDRQTGRRYCPLAALPEARAAFDVCNTPLSEAGALGFEYGYSVEAPEALVLWEAQYGDFANVAQVVIDQFVAAGRAKWGQVSALVLLLPHGYEGQGPEHSSARLGRFLHLAAGDNLRIAYPSTAAQHFHLLRRQAALRQSDPRPLVVMTPKSLLRLPAAAARLPDLAAGRFQVVIDDAAARARAAEIARLVLCCGKVYYELVAAPERPAAVAIVRIEELYPFPAAALQACLGGYPALREVLWVQEGPQNMGPWSYLALRLRELLPEGVRLGYVGRPAMAAPSEGSAERHAAEQARIVRTALAVSEPLRRAGAAATGG